MLVVLEAQAKLLRKIGQRFFDDLIGRELTHLSGLLDLAIDIGERDYFEPQSGGCWKAASYPAASSAATQRQC